MPRLPADLRDTVARALAEDVGRGDVTAVLVPEDDDASAVVTSREHAVLAGGPWFDEVFLQVSDGAAQVNWMARDGDVVRPNQMLCTVDGRARHLLTAERTALNFLQTLSGTATITRHYVKRVQGTAARILDTRKTVPGLRTAQKYAVACGGGTNHRMGLYDAVLIKENHIAAAGSITAAVADARRKLSNQTVEVEVEDLVQLREALASDVDRILLDNFTVEDLARAVAVTGGRVPLEASGNVSLKTAADVAASGVDFISVGGITKHVHAVDLSMRFV